MNGYKALIAGAAFTFLGGAAAFAQTLEQVVVPDDQQIVDKATTLPSAPTDLRAQVVSTTRIALLWQDNSNNESEFQVEGRASTSATFTPLGTTAANVPVVSIVGLDPNTSYVFRVRASNNVGNSAYSNTASGTTLTTEACTPTSSAMCLQNNRFRVQAMFNTPQGLSGDAQTVKLTPDSGYLWFFSDSNIEAIVKVLNACTAASGNHYWVFAGGLTNVRVFMSVTDTAAPPSTPQSTKAYFNPQNVPFQPIQDTVAFATCP